MFQPDGVQYSGATGRRKSRRLAVVVAWLLMVLAGGAAIAPAQAATGGTINSLAIVTVYDGQVTNTLDGSAHNGIVASNDTVGFRWDLNSTDLVDGVLTQTLPEGWTWDEASLQSLDSSSSAYQSQYVLSPDGRTLTATVSIGSGNGNPSVLSLGTLNAVPSGDVANNSSYAPEVSGTDGSQTIKSSADPIVVVNEPRADLNKSRSANNVLSTHDFGDGQGAVPARYADFRITVQEAVGSARIGARNVDIAQPLKIDDSYGFGAATVSGSQAEIVDQSEASADADLTQSGTDLALTLDNFTHIPDAWVTVRLWVRNSEVPVDSETALTVTNTATPENWKTETGDAVAEDPANNTATAVFTKPPSIGSIARDKQVYLFNDQQADPGLSTDPGASGGPYTRVTSGDVNIGSLVASRFWVRPALDNTSDTSTGATDLLAYDFWDLSEQKLASDQVYVGNGANGAVPATDYTVQYTAGTDRSTPESNTWYASASGVPGGISQVTGIRIAYTAGVWAAGTPSASSNFLVAASFRLVGDGGSTATDYAQWSFDEGIASVNAYVTVQNHLLSLAKSADKLAIVSGSPVTYTLKPTVKPSPGNSTAVSVNGLTVVDHLPAGLVSVDTSAVPAVWQVSSAGDPGSGLTLTFTYTGTASSADVLPPITYTVTTSVLAPITSALVNTAVIDAEGNTQSESSRSATATVTVRQAQIITEEKSVVGEAQIEVGDPEVSWESRWYNFQTDSQGKSYFVDVLPWNGDARGTSFHGAAALKSAELTQANAAGSTLEYTTADRATVYAAEANSSAIAWSATPPADLSTVTALRVVVDDFKAGEPGFGGLEVTMSVTGQEAGDVYVNDIRGWLGTNGVLGLSNKASVDVVGSSLSGTVWNDGDRDGVRGAAEPVIPGATVTLLDADGAVVATTITDAAGRYVFTGLHSGDYRTEVDTTTVGAAATDVVINTYDHDADRDSDSGKLSLAKNAVLPDIDYGYAFLHSDISLSKQGTLDGDAVAGGKVTWTFTLTNTGESDLTDVELVDHLAGVTDVTVTWPGDAKKLAVGQSAPASAAYTLTQEDIDRGFVKNTATVTGVDPDGNTVTDDADATVTLPEGASLSLTKSGKLQGTAEVGATVLWSFTVTNTGNVSVSSVEIADQLTGIGDIAWKSWPGASGSLKPGQSVDATATYVLTAADVKKGKVVNTATASGKTPGGANVPSNKATAEVTYPAGGTGAVTGGETESTPSVTPTPDDGYLASTGAMITAVGLAALCLLLVGGASVLVTRRLRRE